MARPYAHVQEVEKEILKMNASVKYPAIYGKRDKYPIQTMYRFLAYPATDITTTSSVWTNPTVMRRWRRRLPGVRSTAGDLWLPTGAAMA